MPKEKVEPEDRIAGAEPSIMRTGLRYPGNLNAKTTEVLAEAALAYERIAKDQEEIEQLKTETRALLAWLRAG